MIQTRLLRLAQLSRFLLASTVMQGGAVGLLAVAQGWLLSRVIERVFLGGAGIPQVAWALQLLLLVIFSRALLAWGIEVSSASLAQRVKAYLRNRLLTRLMSAGPISLRRFNTAELTGALSESLDALEPYYSQFLPQLFLAILVPITVLVAVARSDPLSALVLLLTGPLIPVFMYLIGKQAEQSTSRQWKLLSQMSAYFLDVIQGLTTLKLLGQSKPQVQQIAQVNERFRKVTLEVLRITFLSALALELLSTLSTAVVAVQVGLRLLAGKMTFDTALFVLILAPEYYLPLRLLGQRFHAAMSGVTAGNQVFGILDAFTIPDNRPPTAVDNPPPEDLSNTIEFKEVSYSYPGTDCPALQGLTFNLSPGSLTALVGPSGAGKSTVANLLLGFIKPGGGHIFAGEQDLAALDPGEWRRQVAWLPQNPYLLNASVAENLRLARPDASVDELQQSARLADAHDFIQDLAQGYDTQVGEGGLRLSAGQAQRLALARLFLKDAPLVILDEPAAHLDPDAEQAFLKTLQSLRGSHTVLVIAHHLRSARLADQVLVLDQGRLLQCGPASLLSQLPGLYHDLLEADYQYAEANHKFSTQFHLFTEDPPPASPPPPFSILPPLSPASSHPFTFLYRQLLPFWSQVCLSSLLGFGVILSSVGLMAASSYLISAAALKPSIAELQVAIVGVRFFGLARGILRYLERLVSHDVTFRLLGRLRVWFYQALEPLAPARLLYRQGGDLLSRITSDIASLETFYVRSAAPLLVAALSLIGLVLFFIPFGVELAAVLAGVFLVAALLLPWLLQRLGESLGSHLVQARARLHAGLVDLLQGLPDLLVYDHPSSMLDRTQALAQQYARLQQRLANLNGLQIALTGMLAHLGMFLALIIGIQSVSAGRLPGVYLAVVALAALASFEAVQPLAMAAQQSGAHKHAAARLLQIAAEEPVASTGRPVSGGQPPISVSPHPRLSVSSVSFTYPGEIHPALQDISFNLFSGQRIAIVGPSGAGKTTLLHLLLRFWEYSCGEILVDGVDVRQLGLDDVRRRMAVVPQHTYLFNASLEENLRLANPQASRQQLELALNQSQLLEFANSLPEGLATHLGEHGLRLSAGQRQRLAIARTLLQPATILILDEPTSSLDALTSRGIMHTLNHPPGERSVLLITHRLTGLEEFDEILVLKEGRLVERGTHNALRASGGWYGSHCV